ncbi:MAG TPA: RHS repeat-associated core domain-containing protein [Thermoanaerobaculia bacterium]|nr:RHS repeat-associated core domain-containing protein [Thermoanaerobaculia bacterium]
MHHYYPFGREITDPAGETMKFTGHERDSTPYDYQDYMHARYDNPFLGRFLSVDPKGRYRPTTLPQEWNRYAYALNNPVKIIDPNGRENTIYFVNTLPKTWWTPNASAMLAPRIVGTRYEGRVQVVGPGASAGMLRATITRADSTDIVIIASHAGQSADDARGGNLQMRGPNGQLQTVSGSQLASWANDGSAPKAVIIAGCCSNQVADTVHAATGADAIGTDKRTINTENQPGAIVAAGAIALGMDANTAANMATASPP